jgi:hypothetical protein
MCLNSVHQQPFSQNKEINKKKSLTKNGAIQKNKLFNLVKFINISVISNNHFMLVISEYVDVRNSSSEYIHMCVHTHVHKHTHLYSLSY